MMTVKINPHFPLKDQGLSNASSFENHARHRWYFIKEGFAPKLVEQAIINDGVGPGEVLIDPFSGSGTVPLTGVLSGLKTIGFEVNPFLCFLAATKLHQVSPNKIKPAVDGILRAMEKPMKSPLEGFSTFSEGNRWGRWLFPRSVLRSFEAGKQAISKVDVKIKNLLKLALIGAVMDCCNATRDGKCLRYRKDWGSNQATSAIIRRRFQERAEMISVDLATSPLKKISASVTKGDSRKLIFASPLDKFHICVTSPPYLNSFDYSDIYRPELFLGEFVDSNKSLMNVRLNTIRSHVQANWEMPKQDHFGVLYRECINEIKDRTDDLWNPKIAIMIQAYFEDLAVILRGLRLKAHSRASIWLVISTSAYVGVEIPVDLILAEIGQQSGWFLREVGVLRYLRSSSQHMKNIDSQEDKSIPLRESVVIFDASKNRLK